MTTDVAAREHLVHVLRGGRVFGQLPDEVLHDVAAGMTLQHVRAGERVFREGDESPTMVFVVTGGLRVVRHGPAGELLLYNQIRVGDSVGELGLVLGQPRTADVVALRDSTLGVLTRELFQALLQRHPVSLNEAVVRAVYGSLRHVPSPDRMGHSDSFAVIPLHPDAPAHEVALGLCRALGGAGRVAHVRPVDGHAREALHDPGQPWIDWADALEADHEAVVYECEAAATGWTRRAFGLADQLVFVARADHVPGASEVQHLLAREPAYAFKRAHLALVHPPGAGAAQGVAGWQAGPYERVYPLRLNHAPDHERLARFLMGRTVGLVLGGGGARGFAHVGVLRALQELGVPVDLVGGNSMGALLGALYACDVPLDEVLAQVQRFARGGERLTVPLVSLASGRRVERDLHRLFGDRAIESLWRPYFAAACNLSKACTQVLDRGPLWRAVLASNSPAGLFPPVPFDGDLLVDGAILDNVPVAAMRTRLGIPLEQRRGHGTVIAVDVDVQDDMRVDPALARLSAWGKFKTLGRRQAESPPSIADILYRAGHIAGLAHRGRTQAAADVYLQPPTSDFALMDYKRAHAIAERGYQHAREHLEAWLKRP